jgi:mono/diheme cytochrome c family protein
MRNLLQTTSVCLILLASGSWLVSEAREIWPMNPEMPAVRLFDQTDLAEGKKLFQTRCFVCHGRGGKGDGPSATGLAEKPQDLTDPNWQKSNSDDLIGIVIKQGGIAIGKTGAMPPNPDLTQEQIQGLVAFVRSLATK